MSTDPLRLFEPQPRLKCMCTRAQKSTQNSQCFLPGEIEKKPLVLQNPRTRLSLEWADTAILCVLCQGLGMPCVAALVLSPLVNNEPPSSPGILLISWLSYFTHHVRHNSCKEHDASQGARGGGCSGDLGDIC